MATIQLIYLVTREQLLAEVVIANDKHVVVRNALQIGLIQDEETGQPTMAAASFLPLSDPDENITLERYNIVAIASPPERLVNTYKEKFGHILTPTNSKLLV